MRKEKEVIEDLREMAYMLKQELPQISDEELVRQLEECADRLERALKYSLVD